MSAFAFFLLSLPFAVYILAGIFYLIDQDDKVAAVLSLSWRILLAAGLVTLAGHENRIGVVSAFAFVIVLHATFYLGVRWLITTGRWITESIE